MSELRIRSWIILLVLASTFIQVSFLLKTNIDTLAPDISRHKEYIEYLARHSFAPPPPSGWQLQQPFLYYEWCAVAFKVGKIFKLRDYWFAVRIASRVLYIGYIIFSILLIERFRFPALARLGALSVILFWPSAYLISTRTNSDIGFLFFFMGSLFFLQYWHETLLRKHIALSIIFAGLSLLCKGTGTITFVMIAAVLAQTLLTRQITLQYFWSRIFIWPCIVVTLCFAGYFGRIGYYNWLHDTHLQWFANVKPGDEPAYTPASIYHFIHFHVKDFVRNPGMNWSTADKNLYTFWDGLFRTLLYDDTVIHGPTGLLCTISFFWVCILILCVRKLIICFANGVEFQQYVVVICALIAMISLAMIQRALIPDCRMYNGRRIFPLIPVISILTAAKVKSFAGHDNRFLYIVSSIIILGFSIAANLLTFYNNFP